MFFVFVLLTVRRRRQHGCPEVQVESSHVLHPPPSDLGPLTASQDKGAAHGDGVDDGLLRRRGIQEDGNDRGPKNWHVRSTNKEQRKEARDDASTVSSRTVSPSYIHGQYIRETPISK